MPRFSEVEFYDESEEFRRGYRQAIRDQVSDEIFEAGLQYKAMQMKRLNEHEEQDEGPDLQGRGGTPPAR